MADDFNAVAFAGGGNRCYWQGGFWEALTFARRQNPDFIVGVSAGAFQACVALIGAGPHVRALVFDVCSKTQSGLDWRRLRRGQSPFLVGDMYRALLTKTFGWDQWRALRDAPEILIQVSTPPAAMPAALAALGAIGAYQIEKAFKGGAHSQAGGYIGLTPHWVSTHEAVDPQALVEALMASSSVPPFMPVGRIDGQAALDGGLVDNPPLRRLEKVEAAGGRTLVLSTRSGKPTPPAARRTVVRPSQPLTIDKFSVTDGAGIRGAYELGLRDGEAFARTLA